MFATAVRTIALAAASAIDLRSGRLPDDITLLMLALGLILTSTQEPNALLLAALLGFLAFYLIATLYRWLRVHDGLDNAKLPAGAWLGPPYLAPVSGLSQIRNYPYVFTQANAGIGTRYVRNQTKFTFEIEGGPEIPEDQQGPLGPCRELVPFVPQPVAETELLGRQIDEIDRYIGNYGMGGAGFFGLRLGGELLTIALWGAGSWLTFNGRIIEDIYHRAGNGSAPWNRDQLSRAMPGQTIAGLRLDRTTAHRGRGV